jgi:hypothetical protein
MVTGNEFLKVQQRNIKFDFNPLTQQLNNKFYFTRKVIKTKPNLLDALNIFKWNQFNSKRDYMSFFDLESTQEDVQIVDKQT